MTYKVPYGMSVKVEIVEKDDCKEVIVHCPLYKVKTFGLTFCYSLDYTDSAILRDSSFITAMLQHFPKE